MDIYTFINAIAYNGANGVYININVISDGWQVYSAYTRLKIACTSVFAPYPSIYIDTDRNAVVCVTITNDCTLYNLDTKHQYTYKYDVLKEVRQQSSPYSGDLSSLLSALNQVLRSDGIIT